MKSTAIFIGRFAPLHNGHLEIIKYGEEHFDNFIVLVGSYGNELSLKTPFTWDERREMVDKVVEAKTTIYPLRSFPFENERWAHQITGYDLNTILLAGRHEWYIDLLPYKKQLICSSSNYGLSSTLVREIWASRTDLSPYVPQSTIDFLKTKESLRISYLQELKRESNP